MTWNPSRNPPSLPVLATVMAFVSMACGPAADLPDADVPVIPAVGAVDTECGPTLLSDGPGEGDEIRSDSECFLAEVDAGRGAVWDVVSTTPDGEVVIHRFDHDGESVWITVDSSRARSGQGDVVVWQCRAIEPIDGELPQGRDCTESVGEPLEVVEGLVPPG